MCVECGIRDGGSVCVCFLCFSVPLGFAVDGSVGIFPGVEWFLVDDGLAWCASLVVFCVDGGVGSRAFFPECFGCGSGCCCCSWCAVVGHVFFKCVSLPHK